MLKTNSKQVKEFMKKHTIDCIEAEEGNNFAEQLNNVIDNFKSFYKNWQQRQYPILQDAFAQFMQGLGVNCEYETYTIRELLKTALQQTDEQAYKYNNIQVANLYYYLFYKAFIQICKDNNIDFYNII